MVVLGRGPCRVALSRMSVRIPQPGASPPTSLPPQPIQQASVSPENLHTPRTQRSYCSLETLTRAQRNRSRQGPGGTSAQQVCSRVTPPAALPLRGLCWEVAGLSETLRHSPDSPRPQPHPLAHPQAEVTVKQTDKNPEEDLVTSLLVLPHSESGHLRCETPQQPGPGLTRALCLHPQGFSPSPAERSVPPHVTEPLQGQEPALRVLLLLPRLLL